MDYSVCLGVHYCEGSYPDVDYITAEPGISSSLAVLKGYEPKYQCTLLRTEAAQKVIYFISIIDILQQYTLRKVIAHTFKSLSLGWLHEIDTAPPHYYARRFKTSFTGKVQCFREPEDRVARFSRRLRLAIEAGTIACPTFINPMNTDSWDASCQVRNREKSSGVAHNTRHHCFYMSSNHSSKPSVSGPCGFWRLQICPDPFST